MTKILKHYMTRTAVNSPSNPVSQKVFNDMLYAASADVYQMAKKEQHTSLERKTLANYYARSIYRTTPFGLFSAVEFHNRDSETNKECHAVQYLVKPIIKSEATYKITTLLSKTHFKELKLFKNDNVLEKSGDTLLNVFPIVDKRKDVIEKSIDYNFLIQQILEKIGDDGITFNSLITDFRGIFPEYLLTKIISILIDSHFVLTELEDEQAYTDPNVLINKIDSLDIKVPLFVKDYFSFKEMTLEEFSTKAAEDVNQWFYSQFGTKKAVSYLLEADASQRYDSAEYDNKILRFCNFLKKHSALIPSAEFESDYMWIVDHYGSAKIPLSSLRERIFEDAFLNEHISKNASNAISRKIRSNYQKYINTNNIPLKELFKDVENTDTDSLVDPTFQLCFNISQSGTLQLSPTIGTRSIGSIEGRFSRINPKEFREIIIQKNKYLKELGVTPVTVKLLNVPRFFSLTSDIVDGSDLELSINLIGTGRDVVKLDELYVQAINGQILIFRKRKSDFELIKVEANNMANWRKIYPPIIQKMFLWSERYFRNVLFPLDIIIKEEKVHNPAVFFEDILLLCENWNPIIEIGEGLDRKSFTSKIKNFINLNFPLTKVGLYLENSIV
ncbi:lantibiotic dehydratase [Lactobacillus delbrueckii]|uniref:lantibiotic dehydratase n=1 Tax=Lactobacillus delbrueckii TaxID=1584 RepID=UPI001E566675|nr:lantibiotic dehydratase [Lactobacillus delbrueckii]MCD5492818.1 lantibiotic dehydratase family protein [Lactobacillus delbrueckii subsp. lactis]